MKQWDLDYVSLLFICDLPTLAARRKYFNLCTMYKIVNQLIFFPSNMFSPRVTPFQPSSNHLYYQPFCRTNSYLYSFVLNTCSVWNSLPLSVRSSDSISSFKSSLKDYSWTYDPVYHFMYSNFHAPHNLHSYVFIHHVLAIVYERKNKYHPAMMCLHCRKCL